MRYLDYPTDTVRRARLLVAALAGFLLLFCATSASALDGYADRKGVFVGLGLGGGMGAANVNDDNVSNGFDGGRLLGPAFQGIIGGGIDDNILGGAQLNYWFHNAQRGSQAFSHNHGNLLAVGNFFVFDSLFIEGGGGLAYTSYQGEQGDQFEEYSEMGLALRAGVGFEHFLNGTHAVGFNAGYTRHFYSQSNFDTLGGGFSIRWY